MKNRLQITGNKLQITINMRLYSTKNKNAFVDLKEAVLKGLPDDNGLFMPEHFPKLPQSFIDNLEKYSFQEIAYEVSKCLFLSLIHI